MSNCVGVVYDDRLSTQGIFECRIIEIFYIKCFCALINSETFYKSPENCMRNGKIC